MKKLVIGTGNRHKVEEFKTLLEGSEFVVHSAAICGGMPEVDEAGSTFEANARLKAEALRLIAPADMSVLADDSGLEVDALGGEPGVYSARYAGLEATDQENVSKLLNVLDRIPAGNRTARFRCVLCLIAPDGETLFYSGSCEGSIAFSAKGDGGFGYDPIFIPQGYDLSFSQLGDAVKSRLSHRARAVSLLRE